MNVCTEIDGQAQWEALRKISNVLRRDGQNGQWMAANWCQWAYFSLITEVRTRPGAGARLVRQVRLGRICG